jgi:hypothetical protein
MLERDQRELIGMVIAAIVAVIGFTGMLLADHRVNANSDDATWCWMTSTAGSAGPGGKRPGGADGS